MRKSSFTNRTSKTPPPPKQSNTGNVNVTGTGTGTGNRTLVFENSLISGLGIGIGNSIARDLMNGLSSMKNNSSIQPPHNNCDQIRTELDTCRSLNKDCSDLYTKIHHCVNKKKNELQDTL
jgi:hypothetical protein